MKYITRNHPSALGIWALCEDGVVLSLHGPASFSLTADGSVADSMHDRSRGSAMRALLQVDGWDSLTAAATTDQYMVPWSANPAIAQVGVETSDKRIIDSLHFRAFPLPLMANRETTPWGHDGAVLIGRMDAGTVDGENVVANGIIDWARSDGEDCLRLLATDQLSGVSIDGGPDNVVEEIIDQDDDGWPTDWLVHYENYECMGLTLTPFPAFANTKIKLDAALPADVAEDVDEEEGSGDQAEDVVNASADLTLIIASGDVQLDRPSLDWFDDPRFAGLTRWTIGDEDKRGFRHVFGHLAPWSECHIGVQDSCVLAPRSRTNYAHYTLGRIQCAEGCRVDVGGVAFHIGHADKRLAARPAAAHYDNTANCAAYVVVGEDDFGIWVSGALRRGLSDDELIEIEAARLSGDWRNVNDNLELVASLCVNTGGFPVVDTSVTASGEVETMIASLMPPDNELLPAVRVADASLQAKVTGLERVVRPLLDAEADRLRERVHGSML
jgi:hypothetical protein